MLSVFIRINQPKPSLNHNKNDFLKNINSDHQVFYIVKLGGLQNYYKKIPTRRVVQVGNYECNHIHSF